MCSIPVVFIWVLLKLMIVEIVDVEFAGSPRQRASAVSRCIYAVWLCSSFDLRLDLA